MQGMIPRWFQSLVEERLALFHAVALLGARDTLGW